MVNKKKSPDNWGRPRKQLIEGVKEVSLTVQLPETLIKALRKEGKKQGKSMKELIGTSLLSTYAELLNIPQGDNNLVELEKSNENNLNSRFKKILFKMKRIFIMLIVVMLSFSVDAQNLSTKEVSEAYAEAMKSDVTTFLGIPVDGTVSSMKQKLISKGFVPKKVGTNEFLEGEFNGTDVRVFIVTNNNKVWRIMLADKNRVDEAQIKIRFNILVSQFENNKRYIPLDKYTLSDEEDISYEMTVHNKNYIACFCQVPNWESHTLALQKLVHNELLSKYTEAELKNPSEEITKEIQNTEIKIGTKLMVMKPVWFNIVRSNGEYYICMYYDNEYNHANGEDL